MHFNRDDINLPGFHKFFKEASEEEREHAMKVFLFQLSKPFTCISMRILHFPKGTDRENLCSNQELLKLVIISCILMMLMNDPAVFLRGEIWCWLLPEF